MGPLWLCLGHPTCSHHPRNSQESSPAPQFKSINSLALSLLYVPTLTSVWRGHIQSENWELCPAWALMVLSPWSVNQSSAVPGPAVSQHVVSDIYEKHFKLGANVELVTLVEFACSSYQQHWFHVDHSGASLSSLETLCLPFIGNW